MEFTVTTKGPTFDQLTRKIGKDLTAAHKKAGRQIARKGRAAIRKGAPVMWGQPLGVKTDTDATATSCLVTFTPAPLGGWVMAETGTRPHRIRPRSRDALKFGDVYAEVVNHPGTSGSRAWTRAVERLAKAVGPVIEDVYDEVLS